MKNDPQKHHRRSIRIPDYDYSQPGAYFITMVSQGRECLFGEIKNGQMKLNEAGQIVWEVWNSLSDRYPQVGVGTASVMPNHFHGIVIIDQKRESPQRVTDQMERRRMTLPMVVGYFKMNTAKRINLLRGLEGVPVWQRNYYERIIRNDREYARIHRYIEANASNWDRKDERLYMDASMQLFVSKPSKHPSKNGDGHLPELKQVSPGGGISQPTPQLLGVGKNNCPAG